MSRTHASQAGFTLIELMIVVAIIAILAAIALPAYQDFVARAQVAEGFSLATGAKEAITSYYSDHGSFPADNQAAGMAPPTSVAGKYVTSVTVDPSGSIHVLFSGSANAKISGEILAMQVTDRNGSLTWSCSGLPGRYMPSSCR